MLAHAIASFTFKHVAAIAEEPSIESQAIGDPRLRYAGVAQRPMPCMKLMHPSPGVAARIGGIIPCAVVHHAPSHELGARVVAVAVVVEEVGDGEPADGYAVAGHGPRAGKLIGVTFDGLFFISEGEVLRDI